MKPVAIDTNVLIFGTHVGVVDTRHPRYAEITASRHLLGSHETIVVPTPAWFEFQWSLSADERRVIADLKNRLFLPALDEHAVARAVELSRVWAPSRKANPCDACGRTGNQMDLLIAAIVDVQLDVSTFYTFNLADFEPWATAMRVKLARPPMPPQAELDFPVAVVKSVSDTDE